MFRRRTGAVFKCSTVHVLFILAMYALSVYQCTSYTPVTGNNSRGFSSARSNGNCQQVNVSGNLYSTPQNKVYNSNAYSSAQQLPPVKCKSLRGVKPQWRRALPIQIYDVQNIITLHNGMIDNLIEVLDIWSQLRFELSLTPELNRAIDTRIGTITYHLMQIEYYKQQYCRNQALKNISGCMMARDNIKSHMLVIELEMMKVLEYSMIYLDSYVRHATGNAEDNIPLSWPFTAIHVTPGGDLVGINYQLYYLYVIVEKTNRLWMNSGMKYISGSFKSTMFCAMQTKVAENTISFAKNTIINLRMYMLRSSTIYSEVLVKYVKGLEACINQHEEVYYHAVQNEQVVMDVLDEKEKLAVIFKSPEFRRVEENSAMVGNTALQMGRKLIDHFFFDKPSKNMRKDYPEAVHDLLATTITTMLWMRPLDNDTAGIFERAIKYSKWYISEISRIGGPIYSIKPCDLNGEPDTLLDIIASISTSLANINTLRIPQLSAVGGVLIRHEELVSCINCATFNLIDEIIVLINEFICSVEQSNPAYDLMPILQVPQLSGADAIEMKYILNLLRCKMFRGYELVFSDYLNSTNWFIDAIHRTIAKLSYFILKDLIALQDLIENPELNPTKQALSLQSALNSLNIKMNRKLIWEEILRVKYDKPMAKNAWV